MRAGRCIWGILIRKYDYREVAVAGDGKISWTSIRDLGLGTAVVLANESGEWEVGGEDISSF